MSDWDRIEVVISDAACTGGLSKERYQRIHDAIERLKHDTREATQVLSLANSENIRLSDEVVRLRIAEADAMACVLSHEGRIARLEAKLRDDDD